MREDVRNEWKEIDLRSDPRMLVGWRESRRRLNALRIKLHQDVFGELISLCQPAVNRIQDYKERPFENFAALDDREYFWYGHDELPKHAAPRKESQDDDAGAIEDDAADLVRLVHSVDGLDEATRGDLDDGAFSFYSICWQHLDSMIGFVTRINPVSTLRPGYRFFQYGDAMRSVDHPDFALRDGADLVIGKEGTAILAPFAFETLLGDVGLSFDHVQRDIVTVRTALSQSIKLTPAAEMALRAEASRTRSIAMRLRMLPHRLNTISLTVESLRKSLVAHGIDPDLILSREHEFSFDLDRVKVFLDAIDCRFFEDDLGGERRRADRYSTR